MDGAQGNSYANQSYGIYHSYLQTAIDSVEANFDAGILDNANAYRAVGVILEDATYKFYQEEIGISIY